MNMKNFRAGRIVLMATLALGLGSVMSRADFQVKLFDGATEYDFNTSSTYYSGTPSGGYVIDLSGAGLGFTGTVTVTANSNLPLSGQGEIKITTNGITSLSNGILTIVGSDNSYVVPQGTQLELNSSTGDTYFGTGAGDYQSYQTFLDTNAGLFAMSGSGVSFTTTKTFDLSDGVGSNSHIFDPVSIPVSLPVNYSLTAKMVLSLSSGATIQPTSSAVVTAVPEPASALLVGLGVVGAAVMGRRSSRVRGTHEAS